MLCKLSNALQGYADAVDSKVKKGEEEGEEGKGGGSGGSGGGGNAVIKKFSIDKGRFKGQK